MLYNYTRFLKHSTTKKHMPKKNNDIGQKRKKGSDKRQRTFDLYGKYKPSRIGETRSATKTSNNNKPALPSVPKPAPAPAKNHT